MCAPSAKMRWAYHTMACGLIESFHMPGVENAFQDGKCAQMQKLIYDTSRRLCERLGVQDEDRDIETILFAFEEIQEELCYRMYRYGAKFGL